MTDRQRHDRATAVTTWASSRLRRRCLVPQPDAYLTAAVEDLEAVLAAIADWAEGDPAIGLPDALGPRAVTSLHSLRVALRDARYQSLHGRDGRELAPLGVVEVDPWIVADVAAAAVEVEALAYDRRHPTVAADFDEYRQYRPCLSNEALADAAVLLHRMIDPPQDADTARLASRLDEALRRCEDGGLVVLDAAEEAAHDRIIDQLAIDSDDPPPIIFDHRKDGDQ